MAPTMPSIIPLGATTSAPARAGLEVARHGGDLLADALAGADEQRQDQVADGEGGFAHQVADDRVMAEAAQARGGKHGTDPRLFTPKGFDNLARGQRSATPGRE